MFNTGLFILEVQKRPCLWNLKDCSHSDRQVKLRAWEDIAKVFNTCNDSYSHKNITVNVLQRKWKHLRDYYIREKKRTSKTGTEAGSKTSNGRKRNSPLLEMLNFLDSNRGSDIEGITVEKNDVEENFYPETNEEEGSISDTMTGYEVLNIRPSKIPRTELDQSNSMSEDNGDNNELTASLLSIIKKMSAQERFKFRAQLINATSQESSNIDTEENGIPETRKRQRIAREIIEPEVTKKPKCIELTQPRDEFSIYAEYVANKLRNIRNAHVRHTAEFHINGILYKAEMGEYDNVQKYMKEPSSTTTRDSSNTRNIESMIYEEDDSNDIIKTEILD